MRGSLSEPIFLSQFLNFVAQTHYFHVFSEIFKYIFSLTHLFNGNITFNGLFKGLISFLKFVKVRVGIAEIGKNWEQIWRFNF